MKTTTAVMAVIMSILCIAMANTAMAQDLIVVATKATSQDAQKWTDFLMSNEVPLKHITPQEFEKYKKEQFVVLMGGMDEPDGIRELAKETLSEEEFEYVTQKGNGEMYFKFKVWDPMQTVIVFAGSDRAAAEAARIKNKRDWFNTFITWFDLEAAEETLHVY